MSKGNRLAELFGGFDPGDDDSISADVKRALDVTNIQFRHPDEGYCVAADAGPQMFQTLFPSRFDVQTRETAADGTLTLHTVQTVLFNPPGVESAVRPAMYATMNQTVSLRKSGDAWKITAFENKLARMDSLSSR